MDIDPSDRYDLDREIQVANVDYTIDLPPIPGTTDVHPMDCRCLPCMAEAEYLDYIDYQLIDEDGDRAYAEMLERRAEQGTWFGRDPY